MLRFQTHKFLLGVFVSSHGRRSLDDATTTYRTCSGKREKRQRKHQNNEPDYDFIF